MHWIALRDTLRDTIRQLEQIVKHLERLQQTEGQTVLRSLSVIAHLNDRDCYPTAMVDHCSPDVAADIQTLAAKCPCLIECWPRYRITQLGRQMLRDRSVLHANKTD